MVVSAPDFQILQNPPFITAGHLFTLEFNLIQFFISHYRQHLHRAIVK